MTKRTLEELAGESGFAPEALEKVMNLITVLKGLTNHRLTKNNWVLKGGTAINLLHMEVPRLSVDIDLNFIGIETVEGLKEERDIEIVVKQKTSLKKPAVIRVILSVPFIFKSERGKD